MERAISTTSSQKQEQWLTTQSQQLTNQKNLETRVKLLFAVMSAVWGEKWTRVLDAPGTPAYQLAQVQWIKGTDDLTDEQFSTGFERSKRLENYPPSINQFRTHALEIFGVVKAYSLISKAIDETRDNTIWNSPKKTTIHDILARNEIRFIVVNRVKKKLEKQGVFGLRSDIDDVTKRRIFAIAYKEEYEKVLLNAKYYQNEEFSNKF